jgi:hypothetical protein
VKGTGAVLQTGLSGTLDFGDAPPEGTAEGLGTLQGSGSVTVINGDTVVTGVFGAGQEQGAVSVTPAADGQAPAGVSGQPIEMPAFPFTYVDASRLTWVVDGTRVEVLSNLSVEELRKIAEGLVVND